MCLETEINDVLPLGRERDIKTRGTLAYGIEVEFENYTTLDRAPSKYWGLTRDGSLRNSGIEFVSTILSKSDLRHALNELDTTLKTNTTLDAHARCGTHIHLNMRNRSIGQLYSFITAYTLMEPSLFSLLCPERLTSSFCVPVYKNDNLLKACHYGLKQSRKKSPRQPLHGLVQTSKYSALNVGALNRFGTVEVRLLPSTKDMTLLREWVDIFTRIYDFGVAHSDPIQVVEEYEGTTCRNMQRELLGRTAQISTREQRRAYNAAVLLAGYVEPAWQDLDWSAVCAE